MGSRHKLLSLLSRMTIDTLVSAEVVLASGEIVQANQKENPDLFWGIRGQVSLFRN